MTLLDPSAAAELIAAQTGIAITSRQVLYMAKNSVRDFPKPAVYWHRQNIRFNHEEIQAWIQKNAPGSKLTPRAPKARRVTVTNPSARRAGRV